MPQPHDASTTPGVRILPLHTEGVGILRLVGRVTDPGAMVQLAHRLLDERVAGGHLVLDLDDLVVDDPASLCAFLARLAAAGGGITIPAVVADPGMRRLLRACGAGAAGIACFPRREEAIGVARATGSPDALAVSRH